MEKTSGLFGMTYGSIGYMVMKLYPVKDAAKHLGLSVWTLRAMFYKGAITGVKIGAKLLIPESEMARLVKEGTRPRKAE